MLFILEVNLLGRLAWRSSGPRARSHTFAPPPGLDVLDEGMLLVFAGLGES